MDTMMFVSCQSTFISSPAMMCWGTSIPKAYLFQVSSDRSKHHWTLALSLRDKLALHLIPSVFLHTLQELVAYCPIEFPVQHWPYL